MATPYRSEIDQTKAGVVALALCVVQTLDESDPTIRDRLLPRLDKWYHLLEERGDVHGSELVGMVGHALRDPAEGPSHPPAVSSG